MIRLTMIALACIVAASAAAAQEIAPVSCVNNNTGEERQYQSMIWPEDGENSPLSPCCPNDPVVYCPPELLPCDIFNLQKLQEMVDRVLQEGGIASRGSPLGLFVTTLPGDQLVLVRPQISSWDDGRLSHVQEALRSADVPFREVRLPW